MNHYISDRGDHLITHDGFIQLGCFTHSLEDHKRLNPTIDWIETYWIPDPFCNRYKRVTFQRTEKCNEGSPRTDNAADSGATELDEGSARGLLAGG
jgi:hypothetical protein|tara:strand:+ start:63 stop:350 length:288 start_codon:yes stop_codon:yes gene_type:complete